MVGLGRRDGASWVTSDVAVALAYTAAAFESPAAGFGSWRQDRVCSQAGIDAIPR